MVLSGLSFGGADTVQAATGEYQASITDDKYIDGDVFQCDMLNTQLKNAFGIDGSSNKLVLKLLFGKTSEGEPLEWYIAGHDCNGHNYWNTNTLSLGASNIVLFSTKPFGTSQFNSTQADGNTYKGSTLSNTLESYCYGGDNAKFTEAEDKLMLRTTLENDSADEPVKLYVPRRTGSSKYYVAAKDTIEVKKSQFSYMEDYIWLIAITKRLVVLG